MKLRPLGDQVIVKKIEEEKEEKTTDSGIVIPKTVEDDKKHPEKGIVKAVGPGRKLESGKMSEMGVEEGDEILFNKSFGEVYMEVDGDELMPINIQDVIAVIE